MYEDDLELEGVLRVNLKILIKSKAFRFGTPNFRVNKLSSSCGI